MEYKEAIEILLKLKDKYPLTEEEKEAIIMAAGALDCGKLAENRFRGVLKSMKTKKEKENK
jgi:hypothetical protein